MGGLPEQSGGTRPVARAAPARLTRRPLAGALLLLAGLALGQAPAVASACLEPSPIAPTCGASLELQSRAVDRPADLPTDFAGCRLALESYMLGLERWALCVRNEVELRKLEVRRRLDCLAHNRKSCP